MIQEEVLRHFYMHKGGMNWIGIARSNQPELAKEVGKEEAERIWKKEANRIQQQVTRFKKKLGIELNR